MRRGMDAPREAEAAHGPHPHAPGARPAGRPARRRGLTRRESRRRRRAAYGPRQGLLLRADPGRERSARLAAGDGGSLRSHPSRLSCQGHRRGDRARERDALRARVVDLDVRRAVHRSSGAGDRGGDDLGQPDPLRLRRAAVRRAEGERARKGARNGGDARPLLRDQVGGRGRSGLMAVSFSTDDGIGVITLDKPPANSYDLAFIEELAEAVRAAANDDAVKVVVLRSASERFFSAGADVKAFSENTVEANMEMIRASHETLSSIATIPKIFIAEINAHALGGGLEIALACDLRLAAEGDYRLGTPEVTLGVLPGNGGTQRLPRLIGWSRALELMITGRTVTPAEALGLGIVNALHPADELREKTLEYARGFASGATKAIGNIKLAVHEGLAAGLEGGLQRERELVEELFRSDDGHEGIAAFAEKRQPVFSGR